MGIHTCMNNWYPLQIKYTILLLVIIRKRQLNRGHHCICVYLWFTDKLKIASSSCVLPQKVFGRMLREEQGRCVWNRLHVTTARAGPWAGEAMINKGLWNCVTGTGGERKAVAPFFYKTNRIHKAFITSKKRVHRWQTGGNPCQRKLCMLNIYMDLEQVYEI